MKNELIAEIKKINSQLGLIDINSQLKELSLQELQIVLSCKFADWNLLLLNSK
jgi:hypothetical protein